ncbi:MAG: methyltransferase domain-containing protein [Methanocalculus sp. MSAO_Arc2]|uniref:methyltransferase domain-containing protein n=1 Tax=Methanocalculus sp. MSAO_Arc2 TaxID=2293855 RepID=UPI000FECEDBA|nr:MAG: methyltransferase domain-containing protein [Methanocalculus sp. MSAO_Arc2]
MSRQEEIISLLRNPSSGEALDAEDGVLIDSVSGEQFTIRDGIPVILRPDDIYGWNRTAQRGYDWLSLVYDFIYRFNLGNIQTWLNEIATIIEIHPKDRVLETSVGTGQQFRNLHNHGVEGRFYGNDISFGMLRRCRKNQIKWGVDIGCVQGNAEALPFGDEMFEVVYHIGGINFFNDKEMAIREMIRVAQPGGRLYICDESVKLREKSSLFGRFMPDPDTGVYDPPERFIPDDMLDVTTCSLWDGLFWMVSFHKPDE